MTLYPLELERFLSPRLWGGDRLVSYLGIAEPAEEEPLGESWQVYAGCRILNGPLQGKTLAEASRDHGAALLGTAPMARYGHTFPLLAKFIDAGEALSIQVHPDDAYAREHEPETGFLGKSEAWYILEAAPGAGVIWGFKDALTPEEVRRAAEEARLEAHLNFVPVRAGEVVYNPAGTVHAIGAGVFLFEIQQTSDLTYRLYDYGRRGADGKPRELHLDRALEVADLTPGERAKVPPKELGEGKTELLSTEHFVLERWDVAGDREESTRETSVELLTTISGGLELYAGASHVRLPQGRSVVLPAALGAYTLKGEGALLRAFVPPR
ncbi:type I phosphomannose isomerase catalytic subunit [Truepera radiovictrix]|uniref:Phosphohexomutase n=1 Tax=Truepera radiovictrix (strain DSM 17093 / CIP 108686 / LMG 22925 / RQ-24) TaxID=649638 RepID=D7CXW4_TRURR|nr:type I phosphomannose isomerase catalytic subunit [Truepera radiovictrix]ADI13324.1 mannose-6-phosphate isomerase, class I [Truepera radiovictrix DSM 17093]WMT58111.1 class I mannose-6-phosphate isomerase [Truepera radiovictrix]